LTVISQVTSTLKRQNGPDGVKKTGEFTESSYIILVEVMNLSRRFFDRTEPVSESSQLLFICYTMRNNTLTHNVERRKSPATGLKEP